MYRGMLCYMFRCIYYPTIAICNCFVAKCELWLVSCILEVHSWLEIKCQTECNNDNDKNKGHAYRFRRDLTFSFLTSNWNTDVTILQILIRCLDTEFRFKVAFSSSLEGFVGGRSSKS